MKFAELIKSKLFGKKSIEISAEDFENYYQKYEASKFNVTELALFTTIDLIARSLAKCEFVTVENHKEVNKHEYYLWNYKPNIHQTKTEFVCDAVSNLIFKNECLIFETTDHQLLVADGFSKQEYAVFEDVFTNVTARGHSFKNTFKSSEVIYFKYNNFALNGLLTSMCSAYESLMASAEERYNKAVGHKGILKIDSIATNDVNFQEKFNTLMNERFKTYFRAKNAVLPLFEGFDYSEPSTDAKKTTNQEINDISKLRNEAYSTVGNAFHVPPAIIAGTASQLSDATDAFIANAIDPLAQMLEQGITNARYGVDEFIKGNYLLIDTTTVKHIDAVSSAVNLDKAIASGVLNHKKAQKYCNMLPSNEEWAEQYYITKNYQTADMALKGGENNA